MVTIHIKENSIDGEELLKTGKLNLVSQHNFSELYKYFHNPTGLAGA